MHCFERLAKATFPKRCSERQEDFLRDPVAQILGHNNDLQVWFLPKLRVCSLHLAHPDKVITSSLSSKLEHKKQMNDTEFIFSLDSPHSI